MADPERKLPAGLGGAAMGSHSGPHTEIRPHDEGSLGSLRLGRNLMWRVLRVLGIAAAFLLLCAVNASIVWYYWNLWGAPEAMIVVSWAVVGLAYLGYVGWTRLRRR